MEVSVLGSVGCTIHARYIYHIMIRSCKKFCQRYRHFWNIVGTLGPIASIVTTVFSFFRQHSYPFPSMFIVATKIFQWLRLFSFLKETNMQLSTFVLSISRVSHIIFERTFYLMNKLFF